MELLGRYSNQEHLVRQLHRARSVTQTGHIEQPTRVRQRQTRLSPTDVERLLQRYGAGAPVNNLATEFGINRNTVMQHVARAGTPRRRNRVLNHLDEAVGLYQQGWSLARIGGHFGVHPATVWYAFQREGVATRKPWERNQTS